MVSWWGTDSYFINEKNQIGDIEMMTSAYSSSGSFGSKVGYKSIGNNTYTTRRMNLRSKQTPIHGPVNKSDLNDSYSRSHISRLPQAVSRKLIYLLSQKVSYDSNIIDLIINGFSPNDISSHFHICDHSIVTFGITEKHLGFSNDSHVDSLDRFRRSVVDKVKQDISSKRKLYENTI